MRLLTGFFVFFLACRYGLPALLDDPMVVGSKAGWIFLAVLFGVLLFVVIPSANDLLYGRKFGWGDGKCDKCGGSGRAGYDLAKYGVKEQCRSCQGTGSGPGGPGRPKSED
jgi:hypothetical protein